MKTRNIRKLSQDQLDSPMIARIDRSTKFGNPYVMLNKTDAERARVLSKYRMYAEYRADSIPGYFEELRGKDLACWCSPKPCHGDIIIEILNRTEPL